MLGRTKALTYFSYAWPNKGLDLHMWPNTGRYSLLGRTLALSYFVAESLALSRGGRTLAFFNLPGRTLALTYF